MKVRTNYAGTDYVIPGRLYEIFGDCEYNAEVYLEDAAENEPDVIALNRPCPHLNGEATWEIIEED